MRVNWTFRVRLCQETRDGRIVWVPTVSSHGLDGTTRCSFHPWGFCVCGCVARPWRLSSTGTRQRRLSVLMMNPPPQTGMRRAGDCALSARRPVGGRAVLVRRFRGWRLWTGRPLSKGGQRSTGRQRYTGALCVKVTRKMESDLCPERKLYARMETTSVARREVRASQENLRNKPRVDSSASLRVADTPGGRGGAQSPTVRSQASRCSTKPRAHGRLCPWPWRRSRRPRRPSDSTPATTRRRTTLCRTCPTPRHSCRWTRGPGASRWGIRSSRSPRSPTARTWWWSSPWWSSAWASSGTCRSCASCATTTTWGASPTRCWPTSRCGTSSSSSSACRSWCFTSSPRTGCWESSRAGSSRTWRWEGGIWGWWVHEVCFWDQVWWVSWSKF